MYHDHSYWLRRLPQPLTAAHMVPPTWWRQLKSFRTGLMLMVLSILFHRLMACSQEKCENLGLIFYQKISLPMCSGRCLVTHIKNFKVNSPRKTRESC